MQRIEFQEPLQHLRNNELYFNLWVDACRETRIRIEHFCDIPGFEGRTADSMKAYLREVHGNVLIAWENCISLYTLVLKNYSRELLSVVDSDENTIIELDYLLEFADGLQNVIGKFDSGERELINFYNRYSHLFQTSRPSITELLDELEYARREANEQQQQMEELDARYREAFAEVERLLFFIEAASGKDISGDSGFQYRSGDFARLHPGIYDGLKLSQESILWMVESFFGSDGKVDRDALEKHLIDTALHDTELNYLVLRHLMFDRRVTLEDIADIYPRANYHALVAHMTGIDVRGVMQRIMLEYSDMLMAGVEDHLRGNSLRNPLLTHQNSTVNEFRQIAERAELQAMLRRSQLFTFLEALEPSLSQIDLRRFNNEGIIQYEGQPFIASGLNGLLKSGAYLEDWDELNRYEGNRRTHQNQKFETLAREYGREIAWNGVGFSLSLASGAGAAVAGGAMAAFDLLNSIDNAHRAHWGRNAVLSEVDRTLVEGLTANAVARMGGGVAAIEVPSNGSTNGFRIIATNMSTPRAMTNIAGLSERGISQADAMMAIVESGNPNHGMVRDYVPEGSKPREPFEVALGRTYEANFSNISVQFSQTYPNLRDSTDLAHLPLPVLEEVIRIHGGGR